MPTSSTTSKKPATKRFLTWEKRAAGVYVYLHPMIYGTGDERLIRIEKAADAIGVHIETFRPWVSTSDTKAVSRGFIEKWLPIVENMEWRDVKKLIKGDFCWEMFEGLPDDSRISEDILSQFRNLLDPNGTVYVSKYNKETTISGRRSLALNSTNVKLIKKNTKSAGRNDKGKSRKFLDIEEYVNRLIEKRVAEGDPISKGEIKEELYKHPDCGPESEFYKTKLAPAKKAGWANWFKKVVERGGPGGSKRSGSVIQLDGRRKAARNSKKRRQSASLPVVEVPRVPALNMEMPRVPAINTTTMNTATMNAAEMPRFPTMNTATAMNVADMSRVVTANMNTNLNNTTMNMNMNANMNNTTMNANINTNMNNTTMNTNMNTNMNNTPLNANMNTNMNNTLLNANMNASMNPTDMSRVAATTMNATMNTNMNPTDISRMQQQVPQMALPSFEDFKRRKLSTEDYYMHMQT